MKNNLKNINFLANRELTTPPYNSHCLATLADGRPTVEWYTEPLLCNFFGLPIFPLGRGTKGVFRRNLKKVAMLLCVLLLGIGQMWGEVESHPSSATSSTDLSGISYTIPGTYIAGEGGTKAGTMNSKGVKFRLGNDAVGSEKGFVFNVKTGYKITTIKFNGHANDKSKTAQITNVYVDGTALSTFTTVSLPVKTSSVEFGIYGIEASTSVVFITTGSAASQANLEFTVTYTTSSSSSCTAPTSLKNGTIAQTTAEVSWTSDASAWDVCVSTSNSTPSSATETGVTNKSYQFTGLTANTTYYWWVRTNCGSSQSAWVAGSSFTTATAPVSTYTATIEAGSNGAVNVASVPNLSGSVNVTSSGNTLMVGSTTITATPANGYELDNWTVGSATLAKDGSTSISAATTITANFKSTSGGGGGGTTSDGKMYFWFVKADDATTNGVTQNEDNFFSNAPTGNNSYSDGAQTIAGTNYTISKRSGNTTATVTFTIPTNKKGVLYAVMKGNGTRKLSLQDSNGTEIEYKQPSNDVFKVYEYSTIPAGSYRLVATENVYWAMLAVKVTDAISTDATLKEIKANGQPIAGFDASLISYTVYVPSGSDIPTISATANDTKAKSVDITPATSIPGEATIVVTAEDNKTTKTYTVKFEYMLYTVKFDAQNGTEITSITQESAGAAITLPSPSRTGYDLEGWYKGDVKIEGATYIPTENNVTLTAHWTPINYDITYVLEEGATNSSSNPAQYTIETEDITLAPATKDNAGFVGWFDNNGQQVTTIAKGSTGNITLAAQFASVYNYSYSSTIGELPTQPTEPVAAVTLPNMAAVIGHTFTGWKADQTVLVNNEEKAAETLLVAGTSVQLTAATQFTAQWEINKHKVTFDVKGGSDIAEMTNIEYNSNVDLSDKTPTKDGNSFKGWTSTDVTIDNNAFKMPDKDVTVTATWQPETYEITYDLDGGSWNGTAGNDIYTYGTEYTLPTNVTKQGYIFVKWQKNGSDISKISSTTYGDVAVKAIFREKYAKTIDFLALADENYSTTTTPEHTANIETELENHRYILSSMTNVSWDKPSGKPADKGLKIKNSGTTITFDVASQKLVILTMGSVKNNSAKFSVDGGANYTNLAGSNPMSTGASVVTYYYSDNERTYKYATNNGDYNVIQAITITDPYEVTFTNGGEIEPMYFKGEALTLPTPTGDGAFLGWYTEETEGELVESPYTPTGDVTLYARFQESSGDNSLKSLKYGETSIEIVPLQLDYVVDLPYGTALPTVTYEANSEDATSGEVTQATAATKKATFTVTAKNGDKANYSVTFNIAPKDGISIIKATHTGATTADVEGLIGGTYDKNTQGGGKLGSNDHYFGIKLAAGTFQAGDVLTIYASSTSTKVQIFSDKGTNMLNEGVFVDNIYTFTLEAATEWIYLYRTSTAGSAMNPTLGYIEVFRPMMPQLTAMKINGNDATINEEAKTVTIELPNNGGVVPAISFSGIKIISNTPSLTEGVLGEGEWAFDAARNYTLTDKDGDATVYAITLTEAAAPCETPAINTQPESASYCAGDEMPTLSVDASVSDEGTLVYAWFKKGDTDEQVGNAVSYQVAGAGTYYVKVKNTKDGFGDSEWVTSNDAVVTLNVAAAITTQPVGATEKEVGDHITLSVVASNATGYQWYKDEEAIDGETNDTYEFDFAATASYYVMVGSACGDDIKSDVVSVIAAPQGCNTFASIPSAAPYIYKQEGEWEITALTSGGKLDGSNRFINSATDYKGQTNQKALSYSRIGIKFAQATTSVTFYSSASSSRTFSSLNVTSDDIAGGTVSYSDVTDDVTVTKEDYNGNNKNGVFTATGFFEPNKYYWFTFSGTVVITKVCTTEAEVLEETKTISAATVNSVDLTTEQLSTLNSAKALTWDKVLTQPEVAMTYTITRKYEGDRTFVTDEEKTATITSDASNYYATCTFEGQDYVITCPIDKDPAMSLSVETLDVSFALSAATAKSAEVTLTGYNLENGEYSVNIPTIEGLSITPTVFTVADGQVNETFTVTFAAEDRVTVATKDIIFSDGKTSKTLPVTYGAMLEYTLQDVSENITWDFSKVPANPTASTGGITATEDNQVMANIAGVANNADFNSQTLMMMVAGEYAYRSSSNKCFQGKSLKFNTTIPGMVTINARKAGDGCNVTVGNTNLGELTSTATDYTVFVEAGDVVISVEGAQPVRIYTMTFTAADHYRLGMKAHDLGTFCWPYDVPANQHFGAIFYNIEKADNSFVYFVEETGDLQAGKPYIFEIAEESQSMYVFNGEGDAVDAPDNENANGLYGTFESIEKTDLYNAGNGNPVYGINPANNKVTKLGKNSSVAAYRAYIVVVEISDISAQLAQQTQAGTAPRRLVLGRGDASVVTNLDGAVITNDEGAQKFIINNQLIMIRNGRIYNASGAMLR